MAIVFRTNTGPYTGKGSPLTKEEVDGNFFDLVTRTITLEEVGDFACDSVSYTGSSITFNWSDATTSGPFALPVATFTPRGIWLNSTTYFYLDLVSVVGVGMFLVLINHTTAAAPATFDPSATSGGNPLYLIIGEAPDYTSVMYFRGSYTGGFLYNLDDVFLDETHGLFRVSISHVSATELDPLAVSADSLPLFRQLAGPPFSSVTLITDATYTILTSDRGQYLRFEQGCLVTLPVMANMPIGSEIHFEQAGDEDVMFQTDDDAVTILEQRPGWSTSTPYRGAVVTAKYVAADTWKLIGPHGAEISS